MRVDALSGVAVAKESVAAPVRDGGGEITGRRGDGAFEDGGAGAFDAEVGG